MNKWTQGEINLLKQLYGTMSYKEMVSYFKNRTASTLCRRAGLLRLCETSSNNHVDNRYRINTRWSMAEINLLIWLEVATLLSIRYWR